MIQFESDFKTVGTIYFQISCNSEEAFYEVEYEERVPRIIGFIA